MRAEVNVSRCGTRPIRRTWLCGVTAGVLLVVIGSAALRAEQARTARDGVYTDAQARRGEAVYGQQCASCHAADAGSGAPALVGKEFLGVWGEMWIADLIEKIAISMPTSSPGSLSRGQVADLVAFILKANDLPAGSTELDSADPSLKTIKIGR